MNEVYRTANSVYRTSCGHGNGYVPLSDGPLCPEHHVPATHCRKTHQDADPGSRGGAETTSAEEAK